MFWRASLLGMLLVGALPALAYAHGTAPGVRQIFARSTDTVIATSRGLVFGDPARRRWSLLCGGALGIPDETPYSLAVQPSGALLVASLEGLRRSDDDGCTWTPHPVFGDADITDLAQDAAQPARLHLAIFGGAQAGIHTSDDGGTTFRRRYAAGPDEYIGSLRARGSTLVATVATTEEVPRFFLLRSTDAGATWTRTALALGDQVLDVGVLALHRDALLLRVFYFDQRTGDDLLRSSDGGGTFASAGRFVGLADAAFSADGTSVFLATSEGLMRARTAEYAFARVGDAVSSSHVTVRGDEVLAGVAYPDGELVLPGIAKLAGDPSTPVVRLMTFDSVTTLHACAPPSPVACACEKAWLDWSIEFPKDAASAAPVCAAP
ncbi:MAG: sialidase family protein [Polyangiales bacterium]